MIDQATAAPFDLETVTGLVRHFQALQGLADWSYTVQIVPGLQHEGEDAWATMESTPSADGVGGTGVVRVRDLVATPVAGFEGDAAWNELKVTVSHELWHNWTTILLADPSVENEERLVEAAAQAVVRSAGADARVMARAIKRWTDGMAYLSRGGGARAETQMRARLAKVSARAATRARGGAMDPNMVKEALDAIEGGDAAKCAEILKGLIASAAAGGATPTDAAPDSAAAKVVPAAAPPGAPVDGPPPAAKAVVPPDPAAREAARLVADLARMHSAALPAARARLVTDARARLTLTPATEKRILEAPTFEAAQSILAIVEEAGGGSSLRARSGIEHGSAPDTSGGVPLGEPDDKLLGEGFDQQFIARYRGILKAEGAEAGAGTLARGRVALQRTKARKVRETAQKAVAS